MSVDVGVPWNFPYVKRMVCANQIYIKMTNCWRFPLVLIGCTKCICIIARSQYGFRTQKNEGTDVTSYVCDNNVQTMASSSLGPFSRRTTVALQFENWNSNNHQCRVIRTKNDWNFKSFHNTCKRTPSSIVLFLISFRTVLSPYIHVMCTAQFQKYHIILILPYRTCQVDWRVSHATGSIAVFILLYCTILGR